MGWFDNLSSQGNGSSVYLDELNVISGLQVLWLLLTRSVVSVKYLTLGKFGGLLVFLARHLNLCESVEALDVDFSSRMHGGGLWYAVEETTQDFSREILKRLDENTLLVDYLPVETNPERRSAYMRKLLEIDLYRIVVMALLAERESESTRSKSIILAKLSDLTTLVNAVIKNDAISVQPVADLRNSLLLRSFLFFGKQVTVAKNYLLHTRSSSSRNLKSDINRIALQYSWGLHTENRMGDLWWFGDSGINTSRLLIFFNRNKDPLTDEIANSLEAEGINYVVLNNEANKTSGVKVNLYSHKRLQWIWPDLRTFVRLLFGRNKTICPRWQINQWLRIIINFRSRQAFLLEENIKVLFDVGEFSIDTAALVTDAIGAIKMGIHWSDVGYPRARILPLHQAFFVWGKHYRDVYKEMASPGVLVEVGCIYDKQKVRDLLQQKGQLYKRRLSEAGADFVIGVLDRSLASTSHVPPPYHAKFYETLLRTMIENPEVGLVIKPKYDGDLRILSYYPQLKALLEQAVNTKRVFLLNGKRHVLEAGYSADIVVALGPNSGGIVCALQGSRVIAWDPSNAARGARGEWVSQVGWGDENIVFSDMDSLIDVVLAERKIPPCDRRLGNFSDYVDKIDGFQDGRASERVGRFISDFLSGLDRCLDREEAIDSAVKNYRSVWGNDKVTI